jgi:hypothetical protein
VPKIIRGIDAEDPEKIQIVVRGAEDLYLEIRLDNLFHNQEGKEFVIRFSSTGQRFMASSTCGEHQPDGCDRYGSL